MVCLLPRSVMKIAGHVSLAARIWNLAPENARHLRMYAHYFLFAIDFCAPLLQFQVW
jgi:hypothetical protein